MFLHLVLNSWVCLYYVLSLSYSDFTCLCRLVPADPKAKPTKSGKQRRGGKGKRLKGMVVGETGTEVDVGPVPAKKAKKEGVLTFANKFKQPGSGKTPVQVWADKYEGFMKANGWGNGGKKWPKNWAQREAATAELDHILGRRVLLQLTRAAGGGEACAGSAGAGAAGGGAAGGGAGESTQLGDEMVEEEGGCGEEGAEGDQEEDKEEEEEEEEGEAEDDYEREAPAPLLQDEIDYSVVRTGALSDILD